MQQNYVEKPRKVLAEQFRAGATPPAIGACFCNLSVPYVPTGGSPHVHLVTNQVAVLHDTDWIISNRWDGQQHTGVLTDAQFQEIY